MTNTFLLGGEFIVFVLLSFIDIGNVMSASKEYGTFSQVMCSIIIAVSAIPLGYIVNQVWMMIYSLCFDIHRRIFTEESLQEFEKDLDEKWKCSRMWEQTKILEVKLSLLHRKNADLESSEILNWHKNRLNQLHSNGSIGVGISLAFVVGVCICQFTENEFFIHSFRQYLVQRWGCTLVFGSIVLICIINAHRAFRTLVLYNRVIYHKNCEKCNGKDKNCKNFCKYKYRKEIKRQKEDDSEL